MLNNNLGIYGLKILAEIGRDLVFFPIWWYSQGLYLFVVKILQFLGEQQKSLALFVWIKNIHRPMYGQSDWEGILISVLVRIVQIIVRSIIMIFWILLCLAALLAWLLTPFIIIYQIYFQMFA